MAHPAYSNTNPNRIRALVGGFAGGNQTQFNRADGAGYDFVAGFVLDLDKRNPQTAARLLINFRSWRALEPGRRALAEAALRRIADAPDLSPRHARHHHANAGVSGAERRPAALDLRESRIQRAEESS